MLCRLCQIRESPVCVGVYVLNAYTSMMARVASLLLFLTSCLACGENWTFSVCSSCSISAESSVNYNIGAVA